MGITIIFGERYSGFENSLQLSGISRPTVSLAKITKRFAAISAKHIKFGQCFQPLTINTCTRSKKKKICPYSHKKVTFARSPIPYLTQILNEN